MNWIRKAVVVVSVLVMGSVGSNASAGNATGVVSGITVQNGIMVFSIAAGHASPPACIDSAQRWAFDANTAAGQVMAATVLTNYALGKIMFVAGTGACTAWPGSETVSYLIITN